MPQKKSEKPGRVVRALSDVFRMVEGHQDGIYIYRGEDASTYKLQPKLGRYEFSSDYEWSDVESTLVHDFKRKSAPFLRTVPTSELEWLSLGQHHGLATRLLDWTENPLVAVYFALRNWERSGSDRVIYALRSDELIYVTSDESPYGFGKVVLYEPTHLSPRIPAQQGLFSIHPDPTAVFRSTFLERWVVPRSAVLPVLNALDGLGFNAGSMFPGLDGVAARANESCLG
jgi:hypothetical protein